MPSSPTRTSGALVVLTTLPDQETARSLARRLVEARLAACVNILAPCESVYRWQGALQQDGEIPLVIKTRAEHYPRLETFIRENHPYELPEIVAVEIAAGLPAYLGWIADETLP